MQIVENFLGTKYVLNDFLMLNILSIENRTFMQTNIGDKVYNYDNETVNIKTNINPPTQEIVSNFNVGEFDELNRLAYKCRLWLSSRQLDTRFAQLIIKNEDNSENGEILFSELIDLSNATPTQVFSFNNKLYLSYVDIYIPKEAFDNNPNTYAVVSNVNPYEFKIVTTDRQGNFDFINYFDLQFESIISGTILDQFVDFNLSITPLNFVAIEPLILNKSQSIENYLNSKYNSLGSSSVINVSYFCSFTNTSGTTEFIEINNHNDKFGSLKFAIDTSNLVDDISQLPLTLVVTMNITVDSITLRREKTILLTHGVRKANEVVNNLNISDFVTKEIVEVVDVVNQSIISTPSDNEDSLKEIIQINNPVFGSVLTENLSLSSIDRLFTFNELKTFNLSPESKIYFNLNSEIVIGNYTKNKVVYFDSSDLLIDPKIDDKFNITLLTEINGENKIQTILSGTIIK